MPYHLAMDTFHGRLRVQEDLNSARDAADICEGATTLIAPYQIPDERRISLALECVQTFSEVLADYPKGTELPQRVVSAFELNLAVFAKVSGRAKTVDRTNRVT